MFAPSDRNRWCLAVKEDADVVWFPAKWVRLRINQLKRIQVKRKNGITAFHPSPRSYHAGSTGSTYALFVIFTSSSSVPRLSTSGPMISSSSQSNHSFSPNLSDRNCAHSCAANELSRYVFRNHDRTQYEALVLPENLTTLRER